MSRRESGQAATKPALTPRKVAARVKYVVGLANNPNPALCHVMADDLLYAVLEAIAAGNCTDPQACARAALKTSTAITAAPWWAYA